MANNIVFGTTQKGKRKLIDPEGYSYIVNSVSKRNNVEYWKCTIKKCPGRFIYHPGTGEGKLSGPHWEEEQPDLQEREKDAALERLKELTLSVEEGGNVKAIELVRKVLREVSPEVRALMPTEHLLIDRVRRWAKANNIQLAKASPQDYLLGEGDEHLRVSNVEQHQDPASTDPATNASGIVRGIEVVKTGVVYSEPVTALDECKDVKPSGLIFLQAQVNGHCTAMIEGLKYIWKQSIADGKDLYACQKAQIGCLVTVTVDNVQKKYELRGTHVHSYKMKRSIMIANRLKFKPLKRVDDDGNEIGVASLEDAAFGGTEWPQQSDNFGQQERNHGQSAAGMFPPMSTFPENNEEDGDDDDAGCDDFMNDGEDLQMDSESVPEAVSPEMSRVWESRTRVIAPSSNPSTRKSPHQAQSAVKSGERCFVCGDELMVSETLAASEETFRKACCYLNVKSEGEWFPRASNAKFYSFCESCTNEVTRIHSLYKKVEEIQSLIFKKVESVEKRIADAEIVDNWMAEAPHSTAVRFEGFRKQVLINYRNKLKLRREIRFGRKAGQSFTEVQPGTSAHMFASDPSETIAFQKTCTSDFTNVRESAAPLSRRRTRGGPKSKMAVVESQTSPPELNPQSLFNDSPIDDDDGFLNEFDDHDDAVSVASEKEIKFWESEPSKLDIGRRSSRRRKFYETDDDDNDGLDSAEDDPDYSVEDDQEITKKKTHFSKRSKYLNSKNKTGRNPSEESGKCKPGKRPRKLRFPDAVLTKEGRVFMQGVEIIKNPPGVYKPRPCSVSYSCGSCGKISLGFWHIRQHICGHHLGMYKCHICHKEFTEPSIVEKHITMTHGEPTIGNCPICGKPVRLYKKSMQYHRWGHLGEEEKQDPQYKSWQPTRSKDPNQRTSQAGKQTFMCGQCGKSFKLQLLLKRHEMRHNTPQQEIPLMCQFCGKTFSSRKGLSRHVPRCGPNVQGVTNARVYPCPKCPTRFSTRSTRSKHMRKFHCTVPNTTVEFPFSCQNCPRRFSTRVGLRHHKRVCIDGENGYNSKTASTSQPSTSFQAYSGDSEQVKADPSVISTVSTMEPNQSHDQSSIGSSSSQYGSGSSTATALGFNYNFM